ncbi:MAG: uroporphyrinogen-III synthase [Burkholderiaceae bacterium]
MSRETADDTAASTQPSTVIVTRPKDDAAPLIGLLRERGHEVVAFPVLGIEPVADAGALAATMARIEDYRLVVFVSPNAIRHAVAHRNDAWPHDVTVAVMGPGSVAVLNDLGLSASDVRIVSPADARGPHAIDAEPAPKASASEASSAPSSSRRYDSEALLAALDAAIGLHAGFEGRVLIIRGNGGRAWFADRLRERGVAVDEIESYRRVQPEPDEASSSALGRLFRDDARAAFIVTSSEGLSNLVAMVEAVLEPEASDARQARAWLFKQRIVTPHARIAEKARRMGFSTISLAAPGASGIVAAIE